MTIHQVIRVMVALTGQKICSALIKTTLKCSLCVRKLFEINKIEFCAVLYVRITLVTRVANKYKEWYGFDCNLE